MPTNQNLELDRLLRLLMHVNQGTKLNPTFNVYQLRTLLRLYKEESILVGAFKRKYSVNGSRLSRVLEALCVLGFTKRSRPAYDGRLVIVSLTDSGRAFAESIMNITA